MKRMIWTTILLAACEETTKIDTDPLTEEGELLSDSDGDGYLSDEDCDDEDPTVNPGAAEICDGFDNNCDNQADEGVTETFYADSDADGFGNEGITTEACAAPEGFSTNGSDCDDTDSSAFPSAPEECDGVDNDCDGDIDEDLPQNFFVDADNDGFGDDTLQEQACTLDIGLSTIGGDCDDGDDSINPTAPEACNEVDDDCDGDIDEGVAATSYADADGDGYGDPAVSMDSCELPEGYVADSSDCDDLDSEVSPDAGELCDNIDNDCDGMTDEDDATDASTWYADTDSDGFGTEASTAQACEAPAGHVDNAEDCDDNDDDIHPDAVEACNGIDDDCNGDTDEEGTPGAPQWFADSDGDGFGDLLASITICEVPAGYVADSTDCDDNDDDIRPDAAELCNGEDDNCDGVTDGDDAVDAIVLYTDADGDGYGNQSTGITACAATDGTSETDGDCNDGDDAISPDAAELCDGTDNDCDGDTDEADALDAATWYDDDDDDGYGDPDSFTLACDQPEGTTADSTDCRDSNDYFNPAVTESCDGEDNDCDGEIDEDDAGDADTWYADNDADGYGSAASSMTACEQPAGHVSDSTDCDDYDNDIFPGAVEICNGIDENCDGEGDLGATDATQTYYEDGDTDGYGDPGSTVEGCTLPEGYSENADDCDDETGAINPDAAEVCNSLDDDCNGWTDDEDPALTNAQTWYLDHDGDQYGDALIFQTACTAPASHVADSTDCDDLEADSNPAATEICDGLDNDCDDDTDMEDDSISDALPWFLDSDGDSYGDADQMVQACAAPGGYVADSSDCDDDADDAYPGAAETCDERDTDCDDLDDAADPDVGGLSTWYEDFDADDFGDADSTMEACYAPDGYVADSTDCDDEDDTVYPGAPEVCNGVDSNCDDEEDALGDEADCAADNCLAILDADADAEDGLYWLDVAGDIFEGYCDMTTDGGGWTLIQSYDIDYRSTYYKAPFANVDLPRNQDSHNWDDYRLEQERILELFDDATRFHARCHRDLEVSPTDYLYADIVLITDNYGGYYTESNGSNPHDMSCMVRGYSCEDYNFRWWNIDGGNNWHAGFDMSGILPNATSSEDNFTWHDGGLNTGHLCHTNAGDIVWMVR